MLTGVKADISAFRKFHLSPYREEREKGEKLMNYIIYIILLASLLSALSCVAPRVTAPPEKVSQTQPLPGEVKEAKPFTEWDKTLIESRKEGKVTIYTTNPPLARQALSEGFFKHTGIAIEMVTGTGSEISAKLIAEQRNGLYLADVYSGGTTTGLTALKPQGILASLEPLLFLPEVLDTKLWFRNTLPWLDNDKTIIQTKMTPGHIADIAFNTNLARKEELISWQDLLNPRFKGKMNIWDPTTPGKGLKWVNRALTDYGLDMDYLKALASQEPFTTRDVRMMAEWVARGKHIVAIQPENTTIDEFKAAGAPIKDTVLKESKARLGGAFSGIALINKAPHPKAAKLFINWYLSREGQTAYVRARVEQSAREDVPTDHLPPENIRKPGVEYLLETEEFILQEPKMRAIALEIFGPLLAK